MLLSSIMKWLRRYLFLVNGVGLGILLTRDVPRALSASLNTSRVNRPLQTTEYENYTVTHVVENGIERISYYPKNPRSSTPIVMQHGMWHGAWCWETWQKKLAEWGWESHAHSLPGHAGSALQRPLQFCTLDYYLAFLRDEIQRHEQKPILMGHSMGGALTQWYLKYVDLALPAAVLVAPWVHDMMLPEIALNAVRDPAGFVQSLLTLSAYPQVRTPEVAAANLLSPNAEISAEALHARLNGESALVLFQHNPPMWTPPLPEQVKTPLLWLIGEEDAVIPAAHEKKSAEYYGADARVIPKSGHNIMMDRQQEAVAQQIHEWLVQTVG